METKTTQDVNTGSGNGDTTIKIRVQTEHKHMRNVTLIAHIKTMTNDSDETLLKIQLKNQPPSTIHSFDLTSFNLHRLQLM